MFLTCETTFRPHGNRKVSNSQVFNIPPTHLPNTNVFIAIKETKI